LKEEVKESDDDWVLVILIRRSAARVGKTEVARVFRENFYGLMVGKMIFCLVQVFQSLNKKDILFMYQPQKFLRTHRATKPQSNHPIYILHTRLVRSLVHLVFSYSARSPTATLCQKKSGFSFLGIVSVVDRILVSLWHVRRTTRAVISTKRSSQLS
jgi:hypothetical protein